MYDTHSFAYHSHTLLFCSSLPIYSKSKKTKRLEFSQFQLAKSKTTTRLRLPPFLSNLSRHYGVTRLLNTLAFPPFPIPSSVPLRIPQSPLIFPPISHFFSPSLTPLDLSTTHSNPNYKYNQEAPHHSSRAIRS